MEGLLSTGPTPSSLVGQDSFSLNKSGQSQFSPKPLEDFTLFKDRELGLSISEFWNCMVSKPELGLWVCSLHLRPGRTSTPTPVPSIICHYFHALNWQSAKTLTIWKNPGITLTVFMLTYLQLKSMSTIFFWEKTNGKPSSKRFWWLHIKIFCKNCPSFNTNTDDSVSRHIKSVVLRRRKMVWGTK